MAISRFKTSTLAQGLPKYQKLWDGTSVVENNSFESIATALGTGSSGTITFSSIPSTYKHLQVRLFPKDTGAANPGINLSFNSDTGNNYARHRIIGNGSAALAAGESSTSSIRLLGNAGLSPATSTYSPFVIIISDYASTDKFKTIRSFSGQDSGNAGGVEYASGLWSSTSAISTVTLTLTSGSYTTGTRVALYGIKG